MCVGYDKIFSKIYNFNKHFNHCMYCILPNLMGSKRNISEVSHPMYYCTLALNSRKSKYCSCRTTFEYPLASEIATKAKSTPPSDFNATLLSHDTYNCTIAQANKKFKIFLKLVMKRNNVQLNFLTSSRDWRGQNF